MNFSAIYLTIRDDQKISKGSAYLMTNSVVDDIIVV